MSALDGARRILRMLAWAASLGLVVALAHALLALQLAPLLERIDVDTAMLGLAAVMAAVTFAVVWSASRLIELGARWGAAAGALGALLPMGVLSVAEGASALGPPRVFALRSASVAAAALAGAVAARRRVEPS